MTKPRKPTLTLIRGERTFTPARRLTYFPSEEVLASMNPEDREAVLHLAIAETAMIEQGDEPLQPLVIPKLSPEEEAASWARCEAWLLAQIQAGNTDY
jgi:hypothetical protein